MSFLSGIFSNEAIKKAAFSGLNKLMQDEKLTCIVLRLNPENKESHIPGFDVDMFRESVAVFDADTVGISKDQLMDYVSLYNRREEIEAYSNAYGELSADEREALRDPEVRNIINRYLKAKNLDNGNDSTQDAGRSDSDGDA